MNDMPLSRREMILRLAVAMGASVVGPRLFAAELKPDASGAVPLDFTPDDIALLDEIGETILPATDVPGARAVGIGTFIAMMVRDCYSPRDQAVIRAGVAELAATFERRFHTTFVRGSPADRTTLLNELDREQRAVTRQIARDREPLMRDPDDDPDAPPPHYFHVLKELTIIGYFSSEIGCTQALRFIEVPGRFDGSAPYQKGEHAWFS